VSAKSPRFCNCCIIKALTAVFATLITLTYNSLVRADSVEANWTVVGFEGEAWFITPRVVIGQSQIFDRGFATGVFYYCNYAGQSLTYTRYTNDDFFANQEFRLFSILREEMTLGSEALFVHRITCEGGGNPAERRVMYPFVTNESRKSAWYLFEGGVFSLVTP
jgi:hypothetical protein